MSTKKDEPTNGVKTAVDQVMADKKAETKPAEPKKPGEHKRDATDFDEVSIRLANAYGDLLRSSEESSQLFGALIAERRKTYMNGIADLRTRFNMPPNPRIGIRPDGSRELMWSDQPEQQQQQQQ